MKNKEIKLLTVSEYAKAEGVCTSAIYLRIERETLESTKLFGITLVDPATDKTIKKPRKKVL